MEGIKELKEGSAELLEGAIELNDGAITLYNGVVELKDGTVALFDGVVELTDGTFEFRDQIATIDSDLKGKIKDAINEFLNKDFNPISFVSDKNTNVDFVQFVKVLAE